MLARRRAFGGQGWPQQLDRRGTEDPTAISHALNCARGYIERGERFNRLSRGLRPNSWTTARVYPCQSLTAFLEICVT
jgi:hypothetical protein